MRCFKCGSEEKVEEHHVWCKCFDNPHGNSLGNLRPSRVWLCKGCHDDIRDKIIIPILQIKTGRGFISEYALWKLIAQEDKEIIIAKIVDESWRWLDGEKN